MDAPPVQYVTTPDGYSIAFCESGSGPTLLNVSQVLTDVQSAWPLYPDWMAALVQRFRLVLYDQRGKGYSRQNLPDNLKISDFLLDIQAVVDRLGVDRLLIWGWGTQVHNAVRYTLAYPERVSGLILHLCATSNSAFRRVLINDLPQEDWDTFLYTVAGRGFSAEEHARRVELLRRAMTPENWARQQRASQASSVAGELERLRVPTLVLHPRDYPRLRPEEGMKVAAAIPGARFQLLDGADIYGDAEQGMAAIDRFLADLPNADGQPAATGSALQALSAREIEVLCLLAAGKSNAQIAEALVISQNTVIRHVSNIFAKIGVENRPEAANYAHRHNLT